MHTPRLHRPCWPGHRASALALQSGPLAQHGSAMETRLIIDEAWDLAGDAMSLSLGLYSFGSARIPLPVGSCGGFSFRGVWIAHLTGSMTRSGTEVSRAGGCGLDFAAVCVLEMLFTTPVLSVSLLCVEEALPRDLDDDALREAVFPRGRGRSGMLGSVLS